MDARTYGNGDAPHGDALALAIERGEWERILYHLFVALAEALRIDRQATIDDLLELLEGEAARDD